MNGDEHLGCAEPAPGAEGLAPRRAGHAGDGAPDGGPGGAGPGGGLGERIGRLSGRFWDRAYGWFFDAEFDARYADYDEHTAALRGPDCDGNPTPNQTGRDGRGVRDVPADNRSGPGVLPTQTHRDAAPRPVTLCSDAVPDLPAHRQPGGLHRLVPNDRPGCDHDWDTRWSPAACRRCGRKRREDSRWVMEASDG